MKKECAGVWVIFFLILMCGSSLRLSGLECSSMGIDVMEFYKVGQSGLSPGALMLDNPDCLASCPPLWFAAHNGFLQFFRLDVNFFSIRLLDALAGILTIFAAFLMGREAGGARTGLLAALFVALHPIHIQMSRECYFYVAVTLGCFLLLTAVLRLINRLERQQTPDIFFYAAVIPGFLLATNVQMSSWAFAFLIVIALYTVLLPATFRKKTAFRHVIGLTLILFLIGLPPLLSGWGLRMAYSMTFGSGQEQWGTIFGDKSGSIWGPLWHILSSYLVGRGLARSIASILFAAGGIWVLAVAWKKENKIRCFTCLAVSTVGLLAILQWRSVFPPAARYYSSLFPIMTMLVALGLVRGGDIVISRIKWRQTWSSTVPAGIGASLILLFTVKPALLAARIEGLPPYKAVSAWADAHLSAGTVVLCDRWFTPWNEFRMNPATNVTYTFTVPNEPVQVYEKNRWRESAEAFFARNPEAAFFESKEYWTRLGSWSWPSTNFMHKIEFVDEAGAQLDSMGLAYRAPPPEAPPEWLPVTLYFNTREDVIQRAKVSGSETICLYNKGWGYAKPGWQQGNFEDYRIMTQSASIDLYNLKEVPLTGSLEISAATAERPKTISVNGLTTVFSSGRIRTWIIPVALLPGQNAVPFTSPSADPLFVLDIRWKPLPNQR
jgi:hypothetical protein